MFMDERVTDRAALTPEYVRILTDAQMDLYAFICRLLCNNDAAKDVLQDTNAALIEHAGEYDAGRAFLPWAKAFAYNFAKAYLKRESRSKLVFDDDLVTLIAEETMADVEEPADRELELLDVCMEQLTSPQRALIHARYYRDESIESLAERLKRSAIAVYVQIHRIRRLLGACIEAKLRSPEAGGRA